MLRPVEWYSVPSRVMLYIEPLASFLAPFQGKESSFFFNAFDPVQVIHLIAPKLVKFPCHEPGALDRFTIHFVELACLSRRIAEPNLE